MMSTPRKKRSRGSNTPKIKRSAPASINKELEEIENEETSIEEEIEQFTPSKRKKRNSVSSLNDSLLSISSSQDSTQTPSKKKRKSTQRSAKKQKTTEDSDLEINASQSEVDTDELFESVSKKVALVLVIDEWIKSYKTDKKKATLSLVNFVFKSSSVNSTINEKQFMMDDEGSVTKLIKKITQGNLEEHKDKPLEYPIASRRKESRKFRSSFSEFWKKLIQTCSKQIVYDNFLLPHLIFWLVHISRSTLRAFRHTSTVASFEISKALIKIANDLKTQLETNERLAKAEKKKNRNSSKYKDLSKKSSNISKKISTIEEHLLSIFNGIFVHRYRDTLADIRSECITYFGGWIIEYPSLFLDNNYLKYIGWMLSDDDARVRNASIKSLINIYSDDSLVSQMADFGEYYKQRLSQLICDIDFNCSSQAMKLFVYLDKEGVVDEDALANLYAHVAHDSPLLRNAAAGFIYQKFLSPENNTSKKSRKSDAKFSTEHNQIKSMLNFIEELTPTPDMPNYVVDALWGKLEALKQWDIMVDLLLNDDDNQLSNSQQLLLSRVLLCCVKKANGDIILPSTMASKSEVTTRKEDESRAMLVGEYTNKLTRILPELLRRYKDDQLILEELVNIPSYFDLVTYSTFSSNKKQFKELLNVLSEIFLSSTSIDTLEGISKTFSHMIHKEEHTFKREVEVTFKSIIEQVNQSLIDTSETLNESPEDDDMEEIPIVITLRRIKALISFNNIIDMFDRLYDICDSICTKVNSEATILCIHIKYYYILWNYGKLTSEEQSVDSNKVSDLSDIHSHEIEQLHSILQSDNDNVKFTSFQVLSDLLVMFSPFTEKISPELSSLVYRPSNELVLSIKDYYESQMATETDEADTDEVERKHRITQSFAKLIIFNLLSDKSEEFAPIILLHISKHGRVIEELIKSILKKLKNDHIQNYHEIIFDTLKIQFEVLNMTLPENDDEAWQPLKALAKKLSNASYGIAKIKSNLESLRKLYVTCLTWVFGDINNRANFLTYALSQFHSKITKEVAESVLHSLDGKWPEEENEAISQFKESLENYGKKIQQTKERVVKSTPLKKKMKRTKDVSPSGTDDDIEEFSQDVSLEEEPVRRRSSRLMMR